MSTKDSKKSIFDIFFCFFSLSLFFLLFPTFASAETTAEHFPYRVYASGDAWRDSFYTSGGVDNRYGICSSSLPSGYQVCSINWDIRGFPEIPINSTINNVFIKTYAASSGNSGKLSLGSGGSACNTFNGEWQNNVTTYLFSRNCGFNAYHVPNMRSDFSISHSQQPSFPNTIKLDAISIYVEYTPPYQPPTSTPTPTDTPTPTFTPTPTSPQPFLDLPFKHDGKDFGEVAIKINSYFDHTYPLLSSGLGEPAGFLGQIKISLRAFPRSLLRPC